MKYWMLILAFAVFVQSGTIPRDSLMFYYTFDDSSVVGRTVKDQSGKGFDLTGTANLVLGNGVFGTPHGSLTMDGTYSLSRALNDSLVTGMTAGDFTYGCMVKTSNASSTMSGRMDIAGMGDPYNSGFFLSFNSNYIRVFLGNHGYYDSPTPLNDNLWHFAAVTRASGSVTLYIDGQAANQGAYTESIKPATDSLVVGKHGTKMESFYKGQLDNYFFYKRALAAESIFALWKLFTGFNISIITPADTFTGASPQFSWHSIPSAIAYAAEIDTSVQFTAPILSVPLQDTSFTVPEPLPSRQYYVRIGCNFDDRSAFVFADPKVFIVR